MEGCESPPEGSWLGKRKVLASLGPPPPTEKASSPPFLESLISDSSLFKEPLLKDLNMEVIFSLGVVYRKDVTKRMQGLLKDSTPFQMATSVSKFFFFFFLVFVDYFYFLFLT